MSSLYSLSNIDITDASTFSVYYEDSNHPFSKLHNVKVNIGNTQYKSVEHYYQSQKFIRTHLKLYQQIINAETPATAKLLALNHDGKIREDWSKIQSKIYYRAQKQKFIQNTKLKQILLETKQKPIICIDEGDTCLGVQINKRTKKIMKGENNAGIILSNIRDELLLNDSDDEQKDDEKYENDNSGTSTLIKGNSSEKFDKTYSAIFAPFLLNVVVRLLNNSKRYTLNINDYVGNWGGGIQQIRKCCIDNKVNPLDNNCSWDTLIDLCCISTPCTHNVWNRLLNYNKIKAKRDPMINLYNLLSQWNETGRYHGVYGGYPSASEQELYIQETIPREISEILNFAIINDVFKDAFTAMEKTKKLSPSITQQAQSFVSSVWNMIDRSIAEFIPFQ